MYPEQHSWLVTETMGDCLEQLDQKLGHHPDWLSAMGHSWYTEEVPVVVVTLQNSLLQPLFF